LKKQVAELCFQRLANTGLFITERVGIMAAILTSLRMERADDMFGGPEGRLPTINVEHVDKRCHSSVRVNGDVKRLVNEEIVSIALADDAEIVDKGLLFTDRCIELILSHSRSLVFVPRDLPHATDPLRLEMNGCVDGAAGAHRKT